jgi:hypothetical protein
MAYLRKLDVAKAGIEGSTSLSTVMAGFTPAIHVLLIR